MSKLHHTKYKENYKNYILDCLDSEDDLIGKNLPRQEKIKYLFNRFNSEYDIDIERKGKHKAMTDWLSGLALNIPYYHFDIIELAKEMGSIDENSDDAVEDRVIENYFSFMANMVLLLEDEIKEVA
jgi:hypothetical protein|tara:strand:+ start:5573 stop:5950 length:378 start_codon:yes stop_codon:yes gene_type:complete